MGGYKVLNGPQSQEYGFESMLPFLKWGNFIRVTATIRSCGAGPAVINRIESMSRETAPLLVDAESRHAKARTSLWTNGSCFKGSVTVSIECKSLLAV